MDDTMTDIPVFEVVAQTVKAEGVDRVYAVMGDGNMPWLSHYRAQLGGEVIHARHEAGAASMADGHARATGSVGVCSTTQGPGLTNAITALAIGAWHRTPMVLLTGELPTAYVRDKSGQIYQRVDQAQLVRSVGGEYRSVRSAGNVRADLAWAFVTARRSRRPVVLGIPVDVMRESVTGPVTTTPMYAAASTELRAPQVRPEDVQQLVGLLRGARRPILVGGRGARSQPIRSAMGRLAEQTGAGLATTIRGKGLFDSHPHHLGLAGGYVDPDRRHLFTDADLLVMVGCGMSGHTLDWGDLAPEATVVHVNLEPAAADQAVVSPDFFIHGDAQSVLEAVLDALTDVRAEATPPAWITGSDVDGAALDRAIRFPASGGVDVLHPRSAVEIMDELVPKDWRVVVGIGHFWWYPLHHLTRREPDRYTFAYDFGCIGQTLPIAIGAALASDDGRPTVVIDGDVGLMMNVQEFETVARAGARVTVLVMNDGGSGAEAHRMRAEGFDYQQVQFGRPDFAGMADAMGGRGWIVRDVGELQDALTQVVADPEGLRVVDLHIDPDVASPIILQYLGRD